MVLEWFDNTPLSNIEQQAFMCCDKEIFIRHAIFGKKLFVIVVCTS